MLQAGIGDRGLHVLHVAWCALPLFVATGRMRMLHAACWVFDAARCMLHILLRVAPCVLHAARCASYNACCICQPGMQVACGRVLGIRCILRT
jgi:hypothetical protein